MPNDIKPAKYAVGQVLMTATTRKLFPVIVKEVLQEDGEWFYSIDRKNCLHESMLRALTETEIGQRPEPPLEAAARRLVDAMETCHICTGTLIVDEGAPHCENCSGDCDDHEGDECVSIYDLHLMVKRALAALVNGG